MVSASYYDNVNRIEKDIADLQNKIADEAKKELAKNNQISSVERSITKSTSMSTFQSKQRQIQGYQKDIVGCKTKIADYQKKIAAKNVDLGRKKLDLRKAEAADIKKTQQEQVNFHQNLENSINKQRAKINFIINQNYTQSNENIFTEIKPVKKYDFFISYASEDKDEIVRDLATALQNSGIKVWYDEFVLKVGDSLRKSIDTGLVTSKYGLSLFRHILLKKIGQNMN